MNNSKDENDKPSVKEFKFNINLKTLVIVFFAALLGYMVFSPAESRFAPTTEKPIGQIVKDIKENRVTKAEVNENKVVVTYKDEQKASTFIESSDSFREVLKDNNIPLSSINVVNKDSQTSNMIFALISNLLVVVLIGGFLMFMMRQAKGAQDSVFSFGQSRAKRFNKDMSRITFKDAAGVDEAKKELEEIVDFLKNPEKYKKIGARTPKGVLLTGPAGTGKTLLAKAVAGEANVPFFSIAGSEFMEMLVGIGASRVRDLFATAKKSAPSIIFIDEIDAIGRTRANGTMQSHDEREQTLNQILVEMDGFNPNEQVIVMAATNRGDLLDPALLRPGRFDRRVMVDYPDVEGRKAILAIHGNNKQFTQEVDWDKVASRTVGFSGADLENMLNEAAINAARHNKQLISMEDIEEAATKVKLGPEKKRLQSEYDRKLTAYHEAGHALVSHYQPHTDVVHRISIVSRGMALGYTLIPPGKDKLHETKSHLLERIAVMMGGRAAEQVIFNEVTTGASNDFDQATNVARAMVTDFGMSSLGPVNYGATRDITEWGRSSWEQNQISEEVLAKIDQEIKKILEEGYAKAEGILKEHRKELDLVANELLKTENMDQEQFEKIVGEKQNIHRLQNSVE